MVKEAYDQGRKDLIVEIKNRLTEILDNTDNPNDLMFDIMNLLKSLK
jgi:hypothetical protein